MDGAPWWKEAVIYQIYPASFKDSNGDGLGDIEGIISKLDYLNDLGIDAIWLSPFYKSPQVDYGYDIESYCDVHPPYGTLADVDRFIAECHKRGIKVIFDLVINHTSDQHKWFLESKASRSNPKSEYYIWRDPATDKDGKRKPPSNWRSLFGGSCWEWSEERQQYYFHIWSKQQPDLNWEIAEVRRAIYAEAIQFWTDRGVDGWRIDVFNMYSKHTNQLDKDVPIKQPYSEFQDASMYFCNGPRLHEFVKEMARETFLQHDCVTIGELPGTPNSRLALPYVSHSAKELDMVIRFELHDLDHAGDIYYQYRDWRLSDFKAVTEDAQLLVEPEFDAWAVSYLENHDQARSVSRFASDLPQFREQSAKMLATYLLTLSGTIILYQGEEIGQINAPESWSIDEYRSDVETMNSWSLTLAAAKDDPQALELGRKGVNKTSRIHARTPVQWSNASNGGFSDAQKTWLRVADSYTEINVEDQLHRPDSVLSFYRKLIKMRKQYRECFVYGTFNLKDATNESTMVYTKTHQQRQIMVALNFTAENQEIAIPTGANLMLSTLGDISDSCTLSPYEGRIYQIQNA